jgi:hypothetical protein
LNYWYATESAEWKKTDISRTQIRAGAGIGDVGLRHLRARHREHQIDLTAVSRDVAERSFSVLSLPKFCRIASPMRCKLYAHTIGIDLLELMVNY